MNEYLQWGAGLFVAWSLGVLWRRWGLTVDVWSARLKVQEETLIDCLRDLAELRAQLRKRNSRVPLLGAEPRFDAADRALAADRHHRKWGG